MDVKINCCHATYKYDSKIGKCVFQYGEYSSDVILREERTDRPKIYIRVRLLL